MTDEISGAGRLVQYAIYVYRGLSAREDFAETIGESHILITASADTAVREGLPPPEHRPPLGPIFGGSGPPPQPPSVAARAEKLRRLMTVGSAVCIRTEIPLAEVEMIMAWRDDVGIGFPRDATERALETTLAEETRVLFALGAARPLNNSYAFELFDRAALIHADQDPRPISVMTVTGGLGEVWVSGPIGELDLAAMRHMLGSNDFPISDEGLLRTALDTRSPSLAAFLAAWAALERLIGRSYLVHRDRFLAQPLDRLPASFQSVQTRILEAGSAGPSVINQFLILRWGLGGAGLDEDEALFRRLNKRRASIYHRGDTGEVQTAREEAVRLLMALHGLAAHCVDARSGGLQEGLVDDRE